MIIKKNDLFDFIVLLISVILLTFPSGLQYYINHSIYSFINSYGCIISLFLIIIRIVSLRKIKMSDYKISIMIFVFRFLLLIITIFVSKNSINIVEQLKNLLSIVSIVLLSEYFISNNKLHLFIKYILTVFFIYLIINSSLMLLFPKGIYSAKAYTIDHSAYRVLYYHFLGHRNHFGFILIPVLCLLFIEKYTNKLNKYYYYLMQLMIIYSITLSDSTTTIISLIVFYILMIYIAYCNKKDKKSKIKLNYMIILFLLLNIYVVFIGGGYYSKLIISEVFNRSSNLTGRTTIWNLAFKLIINKPIFGYGNDDVVFFVGNYWYAHNGILDILLQGGLVCLVVYFYIMKHVFTSISKTNNYIIYLLTIPVLGAYMVLMFTESSINYSILYYAVFSILYHLGLKEKALGDNNENRKSIKE